MAFALLGEDRMIDLIPLAEVESCKAYETNEHLGDNDDHGGSGQFALQIDTIHDGYNSGSWFCFLSRSYRGTQLFRVTS